ncbi:MAG: ComEA family DNA-binding protein [bacterium]|nr:ComEA family DNA-binding protein [bacterium]
MLTFLRREQIVIIFLLGLLLGLSLYFYFTSEPIYKININTASQEQLEALPAIGPHKARLIIEYREHFGPFQTIEQIMQVKGIGPYTFKRFADLITVGKRKDSEYTQRGHK